jgi:hypothetical protein
VRRWVAALSVFLAIAAGAAAAGAYAATKPWRPDLQSARDYAKHRRGIIAFAVRTDHGFWGYHQLRTMPSASVAKAMILVAYLDLSSVRDRPLKHSDRAILSPMIRRSDDNATDKVFSHVGFSGLRKLARRVGMARFKTSWHWGRSHIDASDQSRFLLHIDSYIPERHRAFALKLLASVVPSQRWGIARVQPPGWKLYFKGGWGRGTGWVDHQVALLTRGGMRVAVAILTHFDPDHEYGKENVRGLAKRLLKGLGKDSVVE